MAQYGAGIRFYQSDATVNHNDIFDNGYGMSSGFMAGLINAKNNWWGDATGPYHTTNPDGLGDTVSDYVDFTPWVTKPHGLEEHSVEAPIGVYLKASPNPFNKKTEIRFTIQDSRFMIENPELRIYDTGGRLVKSFNLGSWILDHGSAVRWDGTDEYNRQLGSGVYFLKFNVAKENIIEKLVLID